MQLEPNHRVSEAHLRLARTINLAPDFGARLEQGWTLEIERHHLEICADAGFSAIRLLTYLCAHRRARGLDPEMVGQLERIVDKATGLGLAVVVSNHRDPELLSDPVPHLADNLADVTQISDVLEGRGTDVVIEPISEPEQELNQIWNDIVDDLIGAVREADPRRTILLGPQAMNNARFLPELELPPTERNLIVGIHHYWPITFTMQGETFLGADHMFGNPTDWLGTTWDETVAEQGELRSGFASVAEWSAASSRPVFLAEFGTTTNADHASRIRWTRFNRRLAEHHHIPWAVWSFGPIFAIYDAATRTFDHELIAALMD